MSYERERILLDHKRRHLELYIKLCKIQIDYMVCVNGVLTGVGLAFAVGVIIGWGWDALFFASMFFSVAAFSFARVMTLASVNKGHKTAKALLVDPYNPDTIQQTLRDIEGHWNPWNKRKIPDLDFPPYHEGLETL